MRVTMLLCDYCEAVNGKLYIMGGGWSVTGPTASPFGIAMQIQVPWDRANEQHTFRLELVDADGSPALVGEQPLVADGQFEVGRPPGMKPGTPLDFPVAFNFPPLQLPPGARYEWRLTVDGESHDDWRLTFSVRPAPGGPAGAAPGR